MNRLTFPILLWLAGGAAAQSLYRENAWGAGLYQDVVARSVGDIVTILVREETKIENQEKTDLKRSGTFDARITNFDVKPDAFNTLPAFSASSQRQIKGDAIYDKEGRMESRLTAMVVDVLPNGNLVVEGRRTLRTDFETKTVTISGVVRPLDISPSNTVLSESVANARIIYEGNGPLTETTNQGWLARLFTIAFNFFWPF
jgi:flagellar L-ring protein precursor FlgH